MQKITRSLRTKADRVRALAAAGYPRATIASFLGIRYQHVRNVLVTSTSKRRPLRPHGVGEPPAAAWEQASAADEAPVSGRVRVDEEGRVALPGHILAALDSRPGGRIPWRFEDGELKLMSRAAGIRHAQEMVADLVKKYPGSWSDELIAERRAEAAREDAKFKRRRRG